MSNERFHHPFSPSSLQSREACPCYDNTNTESEASFFGTLQHTAVDSSSDDPRLSDAHAFAVADCIRFGESRAALYPGGTVIREQYLPVDDCAYLLEVCSVERFDIITEGGQVSPGYRGKTSWTVVESTTAGYLDFAVISADGTRGEIWDWKFGRNLVTHARDNVQGISYMLGLKRKFPTLRFVKVGFIQPHADDQTEHDFDLETDALTLYVRIKTIVGRSLEARKSGRMDFSTATPNCGSCAFCANIGRCPAVAALALKVGKKYAPLQIPDNVNPSLLPSAEQVGFGIKLAQVVKTWAEAYRTQATAKTIEDMEFIPDGYTLVEFEGKTMVKDIAGVEDIARSFLPDEMKPLVAKLRDIPIGKLDDLVKDATARGAKEETVKRFRDAMAAAGVTTRGNPYAVLRQKQVKETKP